MKFNTEHRPWPMPSRPWVMRWTGWIFTSCMASFRPLRSSMDSFRIRAGGIRRLGMARSRPPFEWKVVRPRCCPSVPASPTLRSSTCEPTCDRAISPEFGSLAWMPKILWLASGKGYISFALHGRQDAMSIERNSDSISFNENTSTGSTCDSSGQLWTDQ